MTTSTIEEPIGFYLTCDDAICPDCFEAEGGLEAWLGFEGWEEPVPIGETFESAADSPTHCKRCEALIKHPLTDEGIRYAREALDEKLHDDTLGRKCIVKQWALTYLDDDDLDLSLPEDVRATVEGWPDRDESSPVFVVWHGGQGYSHSSVAEELEWFRAIRDAKDALVRRYRSGAWERQRLRYLNREPQLVYTPVDSVPEDTSMTVYYANPTLSTDPYPDQRWTLDADANVIEEAA